MSTKEETKKGGVTMRGKYQNQDTNDPRKIPAEYLDENGNWRMLDRRERAAAAKKGYNEGMQDGIYTVARNMKQMGLPIADIAKAAGLSEKEITKL